MRRKKIPAWRDGMRFEEDVDGLEVNLSELSALVHVDIARVEPLLNLAQMGISGMGVNPLGKLSFPVRALTAAYSHMKRAGYEGFPKGSALLDYISRIRGS